MAVPVAERRREGERAIRAVGGLFGPDFLERLARGEVEGQQASAFGLRGSLQEAIAQTYETAKLYWGAFKRRLESPSATDSEVTITREGFVIPFLSLLGYQLTFQREWPEAAGRKWPISHRATPDPESPPVLVVGFHTALTRARPELHHRSPHGLLQDYLNASGHLWGLVTNGQTLRLLRQTPFLRRQAYLEVDLEAILEGDGQADFALLYRLLHITRLPRSRAEARECWLERYHQEAVAQGERAREKLRDGVERFLEELATGLLRESEPAKVAEARRDPGGFYQDLLRLTYRLLFLLVAEARGSLSGNRYYLEGYSLARLARLVDDLEAHTEDHDLWYQLRTLFHLLRDPTPVPELQGKPLASALELAVLNGRLFDPLPLDEDGFRIQNRHLLRALRHLLYYWDEEERTWRRVNYAALDVEELGSVYESLLENHPVISDTGQGLSFRFVRGPERKGTGSYYTPEALVDLVLKETLDPLLKERLEAAGPDPKAQEKALLSLKVVDPAAGSGHFLLGAARRIGRRLAQVRTGEEEPSPEDYRQAVRDVVAHCIYGVDKNPLAVELCRVALWIESHVPDKPLAFLDHRIRVGDSLVGLLDLGVLEEGIPDGAFAPRDEGDRRLAGEVRKQNRRERGGEQGLFGFDFSETVRTLEAKVDHLEGISEDRIEDVYRKEKEYRAFQEDPERRRLLEAADLWTAAFFQPIPAPSEKALITTGMVFARLAGAVPREALELARQLARRHRFFHWPLEFPEVFAQGGFDLVLGNPPWERIKVQDQEFFAARDPEIANARNAAERRRMIAELPERNPSLWREYQEALAAAQGQSLFLRESGLYPLTGRGDINTYSVFAERMRALLRPGGRMGIIVPTGIATDDTNKVFFARVVEQGELACLYDFENRRRIFPAIDARIKFCVLGLQKDSEAKSSSSYGRFAFFLQDVGDLDDPERRFTLTPEDFRLLNPNTKTAPIFRTRKDAELTKHIYRRVPVLIDEVRGEAGNPWGVRFLRMFDMANDSHLFRTREDLEAQGFRLEGNVFVKGNERYLPLYEAKMVHQFDHRYATYTRTDDAEEVSLEDKQNPYYQVLPRYWVRADEVEERLVRRDRDGNVVWFWDRDWLLGWRDIARATDERTVISAVVPRVGVGNKMPLIFSQTSLPLKPLIGAILNCYPLDYVARQKVGGTTLNFFIFEQFPVIPPSTLNSPLPFDWDPFSSILKPSSWPPTVADFIRPRVLELVYTAWDLKPFAEDLGYDGPPFPFDPERRFQLRVELDALFFLLYLGTLEEWKREASPELKALFPTPQDAIAYILDQFPIVRRREEERYGEYRTKRTILEIYEAFLNNLTR
ncbi:N-6 DNA methylase [Thermus sp. SYSU G05001]|uniref:site-specific DNA-methyltransferase (adenine-specific) n=1 Tax=Thermus brevis TaxID=2862456 RepID=A0ABS6ZX81_9DEIN|nr:N-6 DNA methylase [Thermus brevis]MBW6394660.1 N-6 DNA methylase [Thermus brevis]